MAAENVSVGRESGIRPALDASAQAGLLGRQRRGLPLGWGPGYDWAPSYHTPVPLACLRDQNCPSGLGLLGSYSDVIMEHTREVIIYSGKPVRLQ